VTAGRAWLAATVATLAVAGAPCAAHAQADPPPPSPCRATGAVTVAPKLTCPMQRVDITLVVHLTCPAGEQPVGVRRLRVVNELPTELRPMASTDPLQPQPGPALDRTIVAPAGIVTVTHQVLPMAPGQYDLANAFAELEDDRGRVATAALAPATLVVSASCPRVPQLYLPTLYRPTCVPLAEPADVVLLVDRSSSVGNAGLQEATGYVGAFLDALDLTRDRIALVAFDQFARVLAPLGSTRAEIAGRLASLAPAPGTRLERAIQAGVAEITGPRVRPGRRRLLLLVTDGVQLGAGGDDVVLTAAAAARAQDVGILSLALGPRPNLALLDALAGAPGRTVPAASPTDLARAYRRLADTAACVR
jgi:Mg-chelatase subunit ChlD